MSKFLAGRRDSPSIPPSRKNPVYIYVHIFIYIYVYIYVYVYILYIYTYTYIYIACDHEITQAMQFAETSF